MGDKSFTVIRFIADNSVEFVPTTWLDDERRSVLFPSTKPKNFNKRKLTANSQPNPEWPKWEVEVVKSYDSTDQANKRVKKYLHSSDLDSTSTENPTKKRRGQASEVANQLIDEPTSSIYLSQKDVKPLTLVDNVPTPGQGLESSVLKQPSQAETLNPARLVPPFSNQYAQQSNQQQGFNPYYQNPDYMQAYQYPVNYSACNENGHFTQSSNFNASYEYSDNSFIPKSQQPVNTNQDFQAKLLENQEIIIREQREIKGLLLNVISTFNKETDKELPSLLPLFDQDSLDKLEDWLKAPSNYNDLVATLGKFGSYEVSKNIRQILSYIFQHSFALRVRYSQCAGKISFGEKKLADVIRDSVRKNHPSATNEQINKNIASWFRGSGDRQGGRKTRIKGNGDTPANSQAEGSTLREPDTN